MEHLNFGWRYFPDAAASHWEPVSLPHTTALMPADYADHREYQRVSAYERDIELPELGGRHAIVTLSGAAHYAELYVNGEFAGSHACGYTAFVCDISGAARAGRNALRVVLDSRESLDMPPFGGRMDYLAFGGLYREAYMDIKPQRYIADVFVRGDASGRLCADVALAGESEYDDRFEYSLTKDGREVWHCEGGASIDTVIDGASLWSTEHPELYTLTVTYTSGAAEDVYAVEFGFRTVLFTADGFYLNGDRLKLRGLNRHQCYPYVGYAAPARMQERDAYIMKHELGLNAVRTSHYPQSQHFISACDRLGLLVFTELPGWQHIGESENWRTAAENDVREMVMQYRNHPSIMLWGVRINESQDDHALYSVTNALCHMLDDTRQTGGVRFIKNSELLEDVYTYNDFLCSGMDAFTEKKSRVTKHGKAPYLITEYCGHMYPVKPFDSEEKRTELALRHAGILNSAAGDGDAAGSFGWCFADYPTHDDFGAESGICYHGVMDMFRNPKDAAYVYAAQDAKAPVLHITSSMHPGEYPRFMLGRVYALTNCESVRVYRNGEPVTEVKAENADMRALEHPPVPIDDLIGDAMSDSCGISRRSAGRLKTIIRGIEKHGYERLTLREKLLAALTLMEEKRPADELIGIVSRFIGYYGDHTDSFRFEGMSGGEAVVSAEFDFPAKPRLYVDVDSTELVHGDAYDAASIRIRAVDEGGNVLHYCFDPVSIEVTGCIELIGPRLISLVGGMTGAYVKTVGHGAGRVRIDAGRLGWTEFDVDVL